MRDGAYIIFGYGLGPKSESLIRRLADALVSENEAFKDEAGRLRARVEEMEAALGTNEKGGDGLIAALWWTLDLLSLYDRKLVELGEDEARVMDAAHLRGISKAKDALEAARAALSARHEGEESG